MNNLNSKARGHKLILVSRTWCFFPLSFAEKNVFCVFRHPSTKSVRVVETWLLNRAHQTSAKLAWWTKPFHNFRSYDGHFFLKHKLDNQHKGTKVTKRGTKLLNLLCPSLEMRACDTLNLATQALFKLPKTVGLSGTAKRLFPASSQRPREQI